MHPVQAAPRQRAEMDAFGHPKKDAPRAGSAEAKHTMNYQKFYKADAPRAGSAEAKSHCQPSICTRHRCTPCRQRKAK